MPPEKNKTPDTPNEAVPPEAEKVSEEDSTANVPNETKNSYPETVPPSIPDETSNPEIEKETEETAAPPPSSETESSNIPNASSSLTKETLNAKDGSSLSYWLYTPQNATDKMPLIIYLHGGSGKGDDLDILMQNDGFPKYLKDGNFGEVPAYIVIPQVSSNFKGWTDIKNSVRDLADFCVATYGTDADRISLTGHSMGGTGTWNLALAFPELFSHVAPLSGSITISDTNIDALANLPVWAFVGAKDRIVKPDSSIEFISELKKINDSAKITVFDGADHFSIPELVFLDESINIIDWLIS